MTVVEKANELISKHSVKGWRIYIDIKGKGHINMSPKESALKEVSEMIIIDRKQLKYWKEVKSQIEEYGKNSILE